MGEDSAAATDTVLGFISRSREETPMPLPGLESTFAAGLGWSQAGLPAPALTALSVSPFGGLSGASVPKGTASVDHIYSGNAVAAKASGRERPVARGQGYCGGIGAPGGKRNPARHRGEFGRGKFPHLGR